MRNSILDEDSCFSRGWCLSTCTQRNWVPCTTKQMNFLNWNWQEHVCYKVGYAQSLNTRQTGLSDMSPAVNPATSPPSHLLLSLPSCYPSVALPYLGRLLRQLTPEQSMHASEHPVCVDLFPQAGCGAIKCWHAGLHSNVLHCIALQRIAPTTAPAISSKREGPGGKS